MPIEENANLLKLLEPPKVIVSSPPLIVRYLLRYQNSQLFRSMQWLQVNKRKKVFVLLCRLCNSLESSSPSKEQ